MNPHVMSKYASEVERLQAELAQVKAELDRWKGTGKQGQIAKWRDDSQELAALRQQIAEAKPVAWLYEAELSSGSYSPNYFEWRITRNKTEIEGARKISSLYTTPKPCPKCAKALEALQELSTYVSFNGDDWVQRTALEAIAELEGK